MITFDLTAEQVNNLFKTMTDRISTLDRKVEVQRDLLARRCDDEDSSCHVCREPKHRPHEADCIFAGSNR